MGDLAEVTKKRVLRLVEEWKVRLGLGGWETIVSFKAKEEIPDKMAEACITGDRRVARIYIRWPHKNNEGEDDNIEQCVVHELVHCWFDPFFPTNPIRNKARVRLVENAVDAIATALVQAKHECS